MYFKKVKTGFFKYTKMLTLALVEHFCSLENYNQVKLIKQLFSSKTSSNKIATKILFSITILVIFWNFKMF